MPRKTEKEYVYDYNKFVCPNRYTSKVIEYCLLFQTNQNFFDDPLVRDGKAQYILYHGIVYLKFNVMKKNTKSSPVFLTISKLELSGGLIDEPVITAEIPPNVYEFIINDPNAPPVLKAVLEAMPKSKDEYAYISQFEHFGYCHYVILLEKIKKYLQSLSLTV